MNIRTKLNVNNYLLNIKMIIIINRLNGFN